MLLAQGWGCSHHRALSRGRPASSHEEMELTRVCPGWHELCQGEMRQEGVRNEGRKRQKKSRVAVLIPLKLLFLLETGGLLNHRPGSVLFVYSWIIPSRLHLGERWQKPGEGPVRLNIRSSCLPGNYRQSPKLDRKTMKGTDRAHCRPSSGGLQCCVHPVTLDSRCANSELPSSFPYQGG